MDETSSPAQGRRRRGRGRPPTNRSIKRQRKVSSSSSSSADASGDSEREDDADQGDDGDDDEYVLRGNSRPSRTRRRTARAQSAESMTASFSPLLSTRKLAPPVPVPNLTKKSRGRRVPTSAAVGSQNGVQKNNRGYMCKVPGCGKCFARGEHLKRHVRSIHTNEKPHKCPYPGCGKDFSRHDNLGQHMRVHKNFPSKMGFKDGSSPPGDDSA
ncbi:hypothetical protein C8Q75DRAFT_718459 [Abortiporus biennis]|nr:hypothetical protein C8Q75DRAFT_718459 [Abortiporus biennis]